MNKNADIDKYEYSGYGIVFDRRIKIFIPWCGFGQNVLILGADMGSSAHTDKKKKDILFLGRGPTQGFEHTLTAEKKYILLILLWREKQIVWACITMEQIVIYLLMVQKFINLKQKILRL